MKKLLVGLLVLGNLTVQAKTCHVHTTSEGPGLGVLLASYDEVENRNNEIITIVKKNNEVLKDVDFSTFYDGATTEEEIERRSKELEGSLMAIILADKAEDSLNLSTGKLMKIGGPSHASVISLSGLNSKKSAVFDMGLKLSIVCLDK